METTKHRINALELDLRTQGDYAMKMKLENDELRKKIFLRISDEDRAIRVQGPTDRGADSPD